MEDKDEDLIRKFINNGFRNDVQMSNIKHKLMIATMELQAEIDRYSAHSLDDTLTDTVLTDDFINGLQSHINGNTTAYSKLDTKHTLKRDMAYFVYWLIMNYPFIEDAGYPSQNMRISNSLSTIWGRTIIRDGYYNDTDREFLNHVKDWLKENNWVYKKPELNEHHDLYERIESLSL
jgi:hypothetical protein